MATLLGTLFQINSVFNHFLPYLAMNHRILLLLLLLVTNALADWPWSTHYYVIEYKEPGSLTKRIYSEGKTRLEGPFTAFTSWPDGKEIKIKSTLISSIKDIGTSNPDEIARERKQKKEAYYAGLRARADAGDIHVQAFMADAYLQDGDYAAALTWAQKAAEQNHPEGLTCLANMYMHGLGVANDDSLAFDLHKRAAELGCEIGQLTTGWAYHEGSRVAKNDQEAVKWWLAAAKQGNASAQAVLGFAYNGSFEVPKDAVLAYSWFLIASKTNPEDTLVKGEISSLERELSPSQKASAQTLARDFRVEFSEAKQAWLKALETIPKFSN